jgi:hypothetical protein
MSVGAGLVSVGAAAAVAGGSAVSVGGRAVWLAPGVAEELAEKVALGKTRVGVGRPVQAALNNPTRNKMDKARKGNRFRNISFSFPNGCLSRTLKNSSASSRPSCYLEERGLRFNRGGQRFFGLFDQS